jgi:hypothetical protein
MSNMTLMLHFRTSGNSDRWGAGCDKDQWPNESARCHLRSGAQTVALFDIALQLQTKRVTHYESLNKTAEYIS